MRKRDLRRLVWHYDEVVGRLTATTEGEYRDLIRWLARTYGENDPIWPFDDDRFESLEVNRRLFRAWHRVVRDRSDSEIDRLFQIEATRQIAERSHTLFGRPETTGAGDGPRPTSER